MKKALLPFLLLLTISQITAASDDFPQIKGWDQESAVKTCTPDNLWEYINGAAEQFLQYGFKKLEYCDLSQGEIIVTVNIYDMGTALNAFGIYTSETAGAANRHKIGTETILSPPYQCQLLKDRFYVKIEAYEGDITEELGKTLTTSLAKALPGETALPSILATLPAAHRIAGSEGYVKTGFLGLTELRECVFARYLKADKEFRIFTILGSEDNSPKQVMDELGKKWQAAEDGSYLYKKVPYQGYAGVCLKKGRILGVADMESLLDIELVFNDM